MNYSGIIYTKNNPNGFKTSEISISLGELLIVRLPDGVIEFDLRKARLELGGFDQNMIYVYPDSETKTPVVMLQNLDILQELTTSPNLSVRQKAEEVKSHRKKKKINKVIGISIIVIFLAGAIALASQKASAIVVKLIPVKWDEKLGDFAYPSAVASLAPGSSKISDPYVIDGLEEIRKVLTNSLNNSKFKYSITILKAPMENAFALPGGKIVIFSGIILKSESAEELAGVIGHEIMHVEKRHAMRQIVSKLGILTVLQILVGDISGAGGVILQAGSELLSLGYSRSMESEADLEGIELLFRAGIPVEPLIKFFKKMSDNENELKSMEWMLTHPLSKNRAEKLSKIAKSRKIDKKYLFKTNWKALQAHLK